MADYTQPDVVNKRVRFFDGQFLQDQDFIDEQKYHLDRERRLGRLLSITGIVSGLTVIKGGAYQVTVAKGVAVDALGRQLVLATETNLRLSDKFATKQDIELRLVYQETPSDLAQTGGEGARRWDESPKIVALAPDGTVAVAPDGVSSTWEGPTVLLAKLAVAANGDVTVAATAAGKAGLSVPGSVGIGTTNPEYKLTVSNSAQHLQLRRESTETAGGTQLFMELFQHDPDPKKLIPEVFPSIRFHHNNRFWHRLEVQSSGFHFKDGHLPRDTYSDIKAGNITAAGKLNVTGGGGSNIDLVVNGRLQSNNNDGGLWVAEDRFVGGHSTDQIGFFNGRAWRLTVQPSGHVGIGTTTVENAENWNKVVDFLGAGNAKLSVRTANIDSRVMVHDTGHFGSPAGMIIGTKTNHALSFATNGTTRLSINAAGNVGVGTTGPPWKLSVSSSTDHLALYREPTETAGGAHVFLELAQIDARPARVPEVFPSIRFNHHNRFAHRIEGQTSGIHFKIGDPTKNDYSDIKAGNITAAGKLNVTGGGGSNIDLVVNGRLQSNNNDGGLWVASDRFVGGHSTNQVGFYNGSAWRLTVLPNGNVGVGTIGPDYKLGVNASAQHLQLRREDTESAGGTQLFMELYQHDPRRLVPEVFPSIRFHHNNRFWNRIEGRGNGFHFKDGELSRNDYSDIYAKTVTSQGLSIGAVTIGERELSILKRLADGTLHCYLLNVPHNEYAYAASDGFKYDGERRRIFTWAQVKGQRVGQGIWQIEPA